MLNAFSPDFFDGCPGDRYRDFNSPAAVAGLALIITKAFRAVYELGFWKLT